jgi:hypothetical protein
MFHVRAMGNILNGVEFVIKTWTFFLSLWVAVSFVLWVSFQF